MNYSKFPSSDKNLLLNIIYLNYDKNSYSENERIELRDSLENIISDSLDTSSEEFEEYPFIHSSMNNKKDIIISHSKDIHS
jgi:hypothetical protein